MYRLIVETLLGLELEVDQLHLNPKLPRAWDSFKMHYRYRDTFYHITITRIGAGSGDKDQLRLDGNELTGRAVPLVADGQTHHVEMRIH